VLDKITHTRHEFNKTEAWEAGMVVKRGDRYQDVLAVDRNGSTVTVRDEEGKIGLVSPKELITGDVQLFRRSEMEVRSGDLLKFTATDREQGQMANQRYTVESVSEEGNIRLKGRTVASPSIRRRSGRSSISTTDGPLPATVHRGQVAIMSLRLRARKTGVRRWLPVGPSTSQLPASRSTSRFTPTIKRTGLRR
jgi:hypothetical protein